MMSSLRQSPTPPPAASEPHPNRPPQRTLVRWTRRAALLAVLLAAFGLRLAYGWPDPSPSRSWDDRFGLPNVESLLRTHSFRPVNAYHPSLSYLPQTLFLGAVDSCRCLELGTHTRRVLGPRRRADLRANVAGVPAISAVTPLGYRACRLWQSLLGAVAGLLVALLIGRLVSPAWGVAGAAVLVFVPWHVWISALCNEDTALFLGVELAALATLLAIRRRDAFGFGCAGLAIGVALAGKLNAGPAALPLTVWALATAPRDRRQLARLALAGALALATFLVLNPHYVTHFDWVRHDFGVTVDIYRQKAAGEKTGFFGALASGLASPADRGYLGIPLALLALVGLARAARPSIAGDDPARTLGLRVMVLFPLTYVPVYALVTRHVAGRNWLPVLPFAIVLAAAGAATLHGAARRGGRPWLPALVLAAILAAALPVAVRGTRFVYRAVVPPTTELAARVLHRHLRGHPVVLRDVVPDRHWVDQTVSRKRWLEIYVEADDPGLDLARLERARGWLLSAPTAAAILARSPPGTDPAALGPEHRSPALPRPRTRAGRRLARLAHGRAPRDRAVRRLLGQDGRGAARAPGPAPNRERVLRRPLRSRLLRPVGRGAPLLGDDRRRRGAAGPLERRRRLRYRRPLAAGAPWNRATTIRFTERFPAKPTETLLLRCEADRDIRIASPVEVLESVPTGPTAPATEDSPSP